MPVWPPPPPPGGGDLEVIRELIRLTSAMLSARALLAAVLLGAFILAMVAMFRQDVRSLITLGVYCVATIGPVTLLEMHRGR